YAEFGWHTKHAGINILVSKAAAKHGSQPLDTESIQEPSPESTIPVTENVDLSEA
ncbi:calcium sensing receptor, chloroplastic, partial [Fagus crenata]